MWEVVATEAAKTVSASLGGVLVTGAGKVLRSLGRRSPTLPADPQALAALIVQLGEQDPAFAAEIADAVAGVAARASGPGLLPPALFVDRDAARAQLAEPGLRVVAGAYGVGKSALVLRVLHDIAARFPGGHAYVDLDDYREGDTLRTAEVMTSVLRQLEVEVSEAGLPELTQQYLRALVHRRFVLVLDNVLGAAEARVLAQPWPASLVLVTTRMLADDLRMWSPTPPVILHGLDAAGAWQLLDSRCGPGMLAAEPRAAMSLLELCDRMPFAILQVGVRLSRRSGEVGAVSAVLEQFRREADGDGLILACLSRTVAELSRFTVDALTVLARYPGEDLTYTAAEAMLGGSAQVAVDELIDSCLLMRTQHGRLRLHHLVRAHAIRLGQPQAADLEPALDRLLWQVRDTAVAADLAMDAPGQDRLRRYVVPPGLSWPHGHLRPIDWLAGESGLIAALVAQAYHRQRYVEACQLCGTLEVLLTNRGHHWLIEGANQWGILAARALGEPVLEARLHAMQGRIYTLLHQLDRAWQALDTASQLISGVDDPRMHSSVLEFQARVREEGGDYGAAVELLQHCLAIDESHNLVRAGGLHLRMLANVLVKAGRPAEALTRIAAAAPHTSDPRNQARVLMTSARAHVALGDLARAHAELSRARALAVGVGATQYDVELADLEAQLAWQVGDLEAARARWGWLAQVYWNTGDPRFDYYLSRLNQLPLPPG